MRAVHYDRVSTDEQAKEGYSLESQGEKNRAFIRSQGWELVGSYVDSGASAKNLDRPEMKRLMQDAEAKRFDVVVFYRLDRLVRSVVDLHTLLEHFDKNGVMIRSTTEVYDTTSAMGRFFITLVAAIAQWERENLGERVKVGLAKRAEKGLRNTSHIPNGYKLGIGGRLEIDEEKAPFIAQIFDLYAKGYGGTAIQHLLSEKKLTRFGEPLPKNSIMDILKNPVYMGVHRWKDIYVENAHPAIVSRELFERVQQMRDRKQKKEAARSSRDYTFTGILKCAHCGYNMNGHTTMKKLADGSKRAYISYHCQGKHRKLICKAPDIREWRLEEIIFRDIIQQLEMSLKREIYNARIATSQSKPKADHQKERRKLERKISEKKKLIDNWAYAMGSGAMDLDQFVRLREVETEEIKLLEKALQELPIGDKETSKIQTYEQTIEWFKRIQTIWGRMERWDKKQAIQAMFKRLELMHTGGNTWKVINFELAK